MHQHRNPFVLLPFVLAAGAAAPAQDMVAVSWGGQIYSVNSFTATATPIGAGLMGQNALAVDGNGVAWSTSRAGTSTYSLTTIDPVLGGAVVVFPSVDLRGLATIGTQLFGIRDGSPDTFVQVDTVTGVVTPIGPTGLSSIQGLAFHLGTMYAWDLNAGLVTVDLVTGATTDVNPGVGGGSLGLQWLASRSDGKLLAGRDSMYEVDLVTGALTLIGSLGTNLDLRGCDEVFGTARPYGTGCAGTSGTVALTATGPFAGGNTMTTTSTNHAPGVLGTLIFGFSDTVHLGQPLPFLLDPLFGTQSCHLYASIDANVLGVTTPGTPATLSFPIPIPFGFGGFTFHLQHAAFEQVPGGMSWSNGLTVRLAP